MQNTTTIILDFLKPLIPDFQWLADYADKNDGRLKPSKKLLEVIDKHKIQGWEVCYPTMGAWRELSRKKIRELDSSKETPLITDKELDLLNEFKELNSLPEAIYDQTIDDLWQEIPESIRPAVLKLVAAGLLEYCSVMFYGRYLSEIVADAQNGCDESLLKAIRIDSSIRYLDWAESRIKKAELECDQDFIQKLSAKTATAPFATKVKSRIPYLVLSVLDDLDLLSTKGIHTTLADFFEETKIYDQHGELRDEQNIKDTIKGYRKARGRELISPP